MPAGRPFGFLGRIPKPKRACKVKGLAEKRKVFLGLQEKTQSRGLGASALRRNLKTGRVVSTKVSQQTLARYPPQQAKVVE